MNTTKLSSKGQVIIPKNLRTLQHWDTGLELIAIQQDDGVLLRPKNTFERTTLQEVVASLHYSGDTISLDDMAHAIQKGIAEKQS